MIPTALCAIALFDMPYGYYTFLRIAISIFAGCYAFDNFDKDNIKTAILFAGILILFNPLIKIHLDREAWFFIDIVVGLVFPLSSCLSGCEAKDER